MAKRRAYRRRGDPAFGLHVNTVSNVWHLSRGIWKFDIARTPMVVSEDFVSKNIHDEAVKANGERVEVDKKRSRHFERGTW